MVNSFYSKNLHEYGKIKEGFIKLCRSNNKLVDEEVILLK